MKLSIPSLLITGALLAAMPGCTSKNSDDAASAPVALSGTPAPSVSSTQMGPPALTPGTKSPTPVAAQMPETTVIDGKTVKLASTPSGLRYYDIKSGTGPSPADGQTVSVLYTGTLLDGTKFDSSADHGGQPIDFPIGAGRVIKGWDEGIATMKVGGKRRLVIPADLAYGANPPTSTIPPDSILVFDTELVGVK